jgi:hypothetical protein
VLAGEVEVTSVRHERRLRHGAVSVHLDYDASTVVLRCERHQLVSRISLTAEVELGQLLVTFFREHERCADGSPFELDDVATTFE